MLTRLTFEEKFGDLKDQLTAISKRQTTVNTATEAQLTVIENGVTTLKNDVDIKTNRILNRSQTILDRLKQPVTQNSRVHQNQSDNVSDQTANAHTPGSQATSQPQVARTAQPQANMKVTITKPTLLIGSSILKGVSVSSLKPNTAVRTFPGATIDSLSAELFDMNIEQCKTIILHAGGNDADEGTDLDTFVERYRSLVIGLTSPDRRIIVSVLLPRKSVDLKPYDDRLKSLSVEYGIEYVSNYDSFLFASGEMPTMFYLRDKLHLSIREQRSCCPI